MNKKKSLLVIALAYLLALGAAVGVAYLLASFIENKILLLLIADVVATIIIFLFSLWAKSKNVYDPYWSLAPIFLIPGYYLATGEAFNPLHLLIIAPVMIWAVRLTYNWARSFEYLRWQDWRYAKMRQRHPKLYILFSFSFVMLLPTVLVFCGMIPFHELIVGESNLWCLIAGGAVVLIGTLFQALADRDVSKFRAKLQNRGKNIDTGLWRSSRHPNYFGEILVWWGIFLASLPNFIQYGDIVVYFASATGAILITLQICIFNVPQMEKHLLDTRPQYSQYKKTVISPIIPFKRKKQVQRETVFIEETLG